ncbi:oxidoreductase [Spirochaetia bacterium]|nr:oxidoreductase [Spirochaetia bacterium]GHV54227.1 oxidoreductase [Spirochaetia bacterium]
MLKTVIIGLGDISPVHIAAITSLQDKAVLAAGCDTDEGRKASLPPGTAFYADYKEMLRQEKPDVVHICLPHYLHYQAARDAAEAGCNVFAEKPLALNYRDGLEYAKLEAANQVKICICLQNRRNKTSEKLMELLKSGEAGPISGIHGTVAWKRSKAYYDAKSWRGIMSLAGGGCMINQALHTMDLMYYFAGSPIKSVKGTIAQILDYGIEVEDTAAARIEFENGVTGLFTGSVANSRDEAVEIEVSCEKATFTIRNQTLYRRDQGGETILARDDVPALAVGKAVYGNSHQKLIAQFYQVLQTGSGDYIRPQDALMVTRFIDAVRESSETGKTIRF